MRHWGGLRGQQGNGDGVAARPWQGSPSGVACGWLTWCFCTLSTFAFDLCHGFAGEALKEGGWPFCLAVGPSLRFVVSAQP